MSRKLKTASSAPKASDGPKQKVAMKAVATAPNAKSSEYVHESDEDEGMNNVITSAPKPTVPKASQPALKALPKAAKTDNGDSIKQLQQPEKDRKRARTPNGSTKPTSDATKRPPSTAGTPSSKHRLSDASQTSNSTSKLSRQRTTSSPLKPSPLGSSPPTNASDLENEKFHQQISNPSTASTPLIAEALSAKPKPDAVKRLPERAENTSEHSLKRKAGDIDSGIHDHSVPFTNGDISPVPKRAKTSAPSPPAMDSSSESSPICINLLEQAQRFKEYYAKYERLYREISVQANPAADKVDRLVKMHERLQSMKDEIARAAVHG